MKRPKISLIASGYLASLGFILSPDWGVLDPSILGFWLLGLLSGYFILKPSVKEEGK